DLVEVFGFRVVRLELVVADRPRRRDAAVMMDFPEVLLAQPEQGGAEKLRVATHVVVGVRMERCAVLVVPLFLCRVPALDVHGARAPVVLFPPNVVTAFEQEDPLARRREVVSKRPAARARADDDHVVMRHAASMLADWEGFIL